MEQNAVEKEPFAKTAVEDAAETPAKLCAKSPTKHGT